MFFANYLLIIGLILGSFLNSLIFRLEHKIRFRGRSFCPHCKKQISWYDNIPVLSYLVLRGKCRHCQKKISLQYPLVELLTGFLFWGIALKSNLATATPNEVAKLVLIFIITFLLLAIGLYDAKTKFVLSQFCYAAALFSLALALLNYKNEWIIDNLSAYFALFFLSALIPTFFFWSLAKISREKWIGAGDADIALPVGLFLGWPKTLVAYYFAFLVGSVFGIAGIIFKKYGLKSQMALGPFLISGAFFAYFWGEKVIDWYVKIFLG